MVHGFKIELGNIPEKEDEAVFTAEGMFFAPYQFLYGPLFKVPFTIFTLHQIPPSREKTLFFGNVGKNKSLN